FSATTADPFILMDFDVAKQLTESQALPFKLILISYLRFRGYDRALAANVFRKVSLNIKSINMISKFAIAEGLIFCLNQGALPSIEKSIEIAQWLSSHCFTYAEISQTRRCWEMVTVSMLARGSLSDAGYILKRMLKKGISPSYRVWHAFIANY